MLLFFKRHSLIRFALRAILLPSVLILFSSCSNLFFYPKKQMVVTPKEIGLSYKEFHIRSANEPSLNCWFIPAKGKPKGTVIQYHGNAQNMSYHFASVYWLPLYGYNLVTFDYRGYGDSKGAISIDGIVRDSDRILEFVLSLPDPYYHQNIILWGQSLGASLAIITAANSKSQSKIKMVIAEAAFDSFRDIFQQKANTTWLTGLIGYPLSLTIPTKYDPKDQIKKLASPMLFIQATEDPIVPPEYSHRLYLLANNPKELWVIPSNQHINNFTTPESRLELISKIPK